MGSKRILDFIVGALCAGAVLAGSAQAQPLSTDPKTYFILGRDEVRLKDFQITTSGPNCNVGVNDTGGLLRNTNSNFNAPQTQVGADDCGNAGGDVAQCFCDGGGNKFDETCVPFPGILADETLATFIAACNELPGDDFPVPCTPGVQNVSVDENEDCDPLAADSQAGNMRCDLPPGDYGHIEVNRKATISFDGGVYNLLSYHADKDTIMLTTSGQVTLNVCGDAPFEFGDKGAVLGECGSLRLNYVSAVGFVSLGNRKNIGSGDAFMTAHICAPEAEIKLSRDNHLEGNYFTNFASSDFGNHGNCCEEEEQGFCACFDIASPTSLGVGDDLTLTGGCDLTNVTAVKVCGVNCPITGQDDAQIVCTVPDPGVALPVACDVVAVSGTGEFKSNTQVTVNP